MRMALIFIGSMLIIAGVLGMGFADTLDYGTESQYIHNNGIVADPDTYRELLRAGYYSYGRQEFTLDFQSSSAKLASFGAWIKVYEPGTVTGALFRYEEGSWNLLAHESVSKPTGGWHEANFGPFPTTILYPGDQIRIQLHVDSNARLMWAFAYDPPPLRYEVYDTDWHYGDGNAQLAITLSAYLWEEEPGNPTANFYTEPNYLTVNFVDNSTPSEGETLNSWVWDFGDDEMGLGDEVEHTYLQTGNYTVELTVTDTGGGGDSITKDIYVSSEQVGTPITTTAPTGMNHDEAFDISGIASLFMLWLILIIIGGLLIVAGFIT